MDRKVRNLRPLVSSAVLPGGWIRAIREGLGMSSAQLAKRLGVSQAEVFRMEKREARGAVTLKTLERAAAALGCRLGYALVPEVSLQEMVDKRAEQAARRLLRRVVQTMTLEAQQSGEEVLEDQVRELARELRDKARPEVWEDA